ncbi:MAG: beta-ketoacyl-ACP synthase [Gammaproteobacteria bacterium]|nr:beta-ketoacyl-ACP synthase [Gammaproteobacteria bacterium]
MQNRYDEYLKTPDILAEMIAPRLDPLSLSAYTLTCAAGHGMAEVRQSIAAGRTGLSGDAWPESEVDTVLGRVFGVYDAALKIATEDECRNNRLALLGLQNDRFLDAVERVKEKFGRDRCAVIIGTSTSSIERSEYAFAHLTAAGEFPPECMQMDMHHPHATTAFIARTLDISGATMTISTACSSSAKTFASAARWMDCGIADAVIVGGVDSLCLSVIHGFHSLQLVSPTACRPFDLKRDGINLGEAAGFALLTREPRGDCPVVLLGYGESCDAYHMSSAHPDGLGAEIAMQAAIDRSGRSFADIDYINMHGTGTRSNDDIEGRVCAKLFPPTTSASSTKGWTGHTLGAAGITEAIIAFDTLLTDTLPATLNTTDPDPTLAASLLLENKQTRVDIVMSNSFGFGGNNCSLIFGRSNT